MAMQDASQAMSREAIRSLFTTPKRQLVNHNPKQPHLGALGAAQPTPKSRANKMDIVARQENDEDHVEITNAPKG